MSWQADQLRYLSGPDPGFELAHPNIYPIDELPECMKWPVLHIQKYGVSLTQSNNRISERSSSEVPVLTEKEKLEASFKTNEMLQQNIFKQSSKE